MDNCGFYSLNEDYLQIETWADNWNVMFGAAKSLNVSRLKDAETGHSSLTFMNSMNTCQKWEGILGISIQKELSCSRQDGQGCRKAAWPPEKSFTLLEPKPVGYDLQEPGEIQDGICLICLDGCL